MNGERDGRTRMARINRGVPLETIARALIYVCVMNEVQMLV
jgi:hypothetical protein